MALQSLKDLGRLTYRRFLELFRHMVGLLGRVINPSQGLCLHRTTQYRKTRTNIHALSGIRTHNPSNQQAKIHTSDCTATVTGIIPYTRQKSSYIYLRTWSVFRFVCIWRNTRKSYVMHLLMQTANRSYYWQTNMNKKLSSTLFSTDLSHEI
jgi:hypothetical protein